MRRAWLLARVSTTKKSQAESPRRQLTELRDYCHRQGWRCVGFGAEAESGKQIHGRPKFDRAMRAIRGGRVDVLCVTSIDRLGRNLRELLEVAEELKRRGVGLVVLDMGGLRFCDTSTPHGFVMFAMFGAFAQFFRDDYARRAKEGQQAARARGKHIGRPRADVPIEHVRAALRLRALGQTWRTVSHNLFVMGMRQPARAYRGHLRPARPWPPGTLHRAVEALSKSPQRNDGANPSPDAGSA